MLHRSRYMASLHFDPIIRPMECLQYIVMAFAARCEEQYKHLSMSLYQQALACAEADEMMVSSSTMRITLLISLTYGQGTRFPALAHAQTWCLLANFEAQHMMLSKACTSLGRSIRIAQMLRLYSVQQHEQFPTFPLGTLCEWSDLEEQHRTWWAIFCSDRLVSATTGWPILIDEHDVSFATRMPTL